MNLIELTKNMFCYAKDTLLPYGALGVLILSALESIILPIPTDPLLIILILNNQELTWLYILAATLGSVIGGSIAYKIGYAGEQLIETKYHKKSPLVKKIHRWYEKYEFLTVFIAAITPIPYKIASWTAGIFYVNYKKFLAASIIGRGIRFTIVALMVILSEKIGFIAWIKENPLLFTTIISITAIITYYLYKRILEEKTKKIKKKIRKKLETIEEKVLKTEGKERKKEKERGIKK